jgi:hypothetical protein
MGLTLNIVTFFDEAFAPLGELTSAVAREHAARQGFGFRCHRKVLLPDRHVYWNKLAVLLEELDRAEYTLWLDADVLVVGRRDIEDLMQEQELVVSRDLDGLCTGVILARNTPWVRGFLEAWLMLGEVDSGRSQLYEARNLRDQTTLKCLVANFPDVRARVGTWPETVVLNPRSGYSEHPLLMHYWASSGRLGEIMDRVALFRQGGWSRQCHLDWGGASGEGAHAQAGRAEE